MPPRQHTVEMRELLDKCYKAEMNLLKNPTPEAKEAFKQAERERHRQIYKENTVAEKERVKRWASQEVECHLCNVKLKKASLRSLKI